MEKKVREEKRSFSAVKSYFLWITQEILVANLPCFRSAPFVEQ
jgi:hypothetical protein